MSNNDLEVYIYEGNDGEEVPKSVEHLIVKDGVRILPDQLCYHGYQRLRKVTFPDGLITIGDRAFDHCYNLLEINKIPWTIQVIGEDAFGYCKKLKEIEFEECNVSLPHQLSTINQSSFTNCDSLERVKLSSSVSVLGNSIFAFCNSLTEANLSKTCVKEIPDSAFYSCRFLQTVSLPNTLERICEWAFGDCAQLVTVILCLDDSNPIRIGPLSFRYCGALRNMALPKGSTADSYREWEEPFEGCTALRDQFGTVTDMVIAGLIGRFDGFSIHKMCYDHSATTVEGLRQCIHQEESSLVDAFGMTPFHVFFSTVEPREDLLHVLLDSLPNHILRYEDANYRRPLDSLIKNWTDANASLFVTTVQKWMVDPLARWGATAWMEAVQNSRHHEILDELRVGKKINLCNKLYDDFHHYETIEATSQLELVLWKLKLNSGRTADGSKRQALNRDECRCVSGSDVVIPNVWKFLR